MEFFLKIVEIITIFASANIAVLLAWHINNSDRNYEKKHKLLTDLQKTTWNTDPDKLLEILDSLEYLYPRKVRRFIFLWREESSDNKKVLDCISNYRQLLNSNMSNIKGNKIVKNIGEDFNRSHNELIKLIDN